MEENVKIENNVQIEKNSFYAIYFWSGIIGALILVAIALYNFYSTSRLLGTLGFSQFSSRVSVWSYFFSPYFLITIAVAVLFILIGLGKVEKTKTSNMTLYIFIVYIIALIIYKIYGSFFHGGASTDVLLSVILYSYSVSALAILAIISLVLGLRAKSKA